MILKVRAEGGIDAGDDVIRGWLLDRIERMVVEAKWRRAEVAFASTTAGDATYANPANVVDVESVKVDGEPYGLATINELWDLKQGNAVLRGRGGVFAPWYSSDGSAEGIELWPVPDAAGLDIVALCAIKPATTADASEPPVPSEFHYGIWGGAIADGLGLTEERLSAAGFWEAKFETATAKLAARRKSLIGSGPIQIGMPTY